MRTCNQVRLSPYAFPVKPNKIDMRQYIFVDRTIKSNSVIKYVLSYIIKYG